MYSMYQVSTATASPPPSLVDLSNNLCIIETSFANPRQTLAVVDIWHMEYIFIYVRQTESISIRSGAGIRIRCNGSCGSVGS